MFSRQIGARVIIELVSLLLMVVGLVFGIVALFGIRTHGKSGILAPAIVGIIINGLLAFIFVTNFLAARARAQRGVDAIPGFVSANRESRHEDGRKVYQGDRLAFDFTDAYELKTNKATGQVLLQHSDSNVAITHYDQLVDAVESLKLYASELQQEFKRKSYGGITQNDIEVVDGLTRSGNVVRIEYDKPGTGRVHADVYILSGQADSLSVLHLYPETRKANAQRHFQTVLQSLKDGG